MCQLAPEFTIVTQDRLFISLFIFSVAHLFVLFLQFDFTYLKSYDSVSEGCFIFI